MIEQLITSSFLILAVLLLRMLLRGRVSRRMLYGLWLVVALRLLLPISIPSPVSVMNAVDPSGAQQFINQQVIRVNPDLSDALSTEEDSPSREPAASPISRGMLLHAVWLGGAVATGLTFAVVNLSFSRRLRLSVEYIPAARPVGAGAFRPFLRCGECASRRFLPLFRKRGHHPLHHQAGAVGQGLCE